MATRVPALERAISILNLLADSPDRPLRATTIAEYLGISGATCFSILMGLSDAGLVSRDPSTKTYALGPRLAALGAAARSRYDGLAEAGAEIRRLAERFRVDCLVAAAVAETIVVVDRATPPGLRQSQAVPAEVALAPPAGLVYMSWVGADAFDAWLVRHGRVEETELDVYRQAAAIVRHRGYAGGLESSEEQLVQIVDQLSHVRDVGLRKQLATDLLALMRHGVNFITAPVFAADGTVPLAVTVINPPEAVVGTTFSELVGELVAAAGRVTESVGGRRPGHPA